MKKVIALILVIALFGSFATAESIDLSAMSDDELRNLMSSIDQEMLTRGLIGNAELTVGKYIVGSDIPVGQYLITPKSQDHKSEWVEVWTNSESKWPEKLYEFVKAGEMPSVHISLDEGNILVIHFDVEATICAGIKFE